MTAVVGHRAVRRGFSVRAEVGESCGSLFDDRWDDLVRRQPLPNPTLSATWLRHLVDWEEGQPVAIVVEQEGALVAAGAFGLYRPAGLVGPTFARWLGDHRQWFSPELLVDPKVSAAGEAVVDALLGLADVVHLPAAAHGATYAALRATVPWLTELPGAEGWIAPLPPPRMEEALTRFRRDCRRAARRGAEVTLRLASSPDEVVVALERLFVLHVERWRMRGGEIPRFSTTEAHRAWYRRMVAAMAERREVLIAEVMEDGELFATDHGARRRARRCHAHDGAFVSAEGSTSQVAHRSCTYASRWRRPVFRRSTWVGAPATRGARRRGSARPASS